MPLWRNDPALYCEERLGITIWPKLEEVLVSVRDNPRTAVQSANGVGKTYIAAALVCWWLEVHEEAIVFITGSNWNAIEQAIFPHIRHFARTRNLFPPESVLNTHVKITDRKFAFGRASNKQEGIQGIHSANLLQIVEESSGLEQSMADAIDGNATGDNTRTLALGNPLSCDPPFYTWCTSPEFNVIKITAFEHPNIVKNEEVITGAVTRANIESRLRTQCKECEPNASGSFYVDWLDKWYIPDNRFISRTMGEFPSASPDALISRDLLEKAAKRPHLTDGLPVASCDVARFGDDRTVVATAYTHGIDSFTSWQGKRVTETAGHLVQMSAKTQNILVDDSGVGGGVTDILNEQGVESEGVNFGEKSRSPETVTGDPDGAPRFANLVTEMAWKFKQGLESDKDFFIPNDPELINEASDRKIFVNSRGQLVLEPKEAFKKRLKRSPDKFDAAIMAYYGVTYTAPVAAVAPVPKEFQEDGAYEGDFNFSKYD